MLDDIASKVRIKPIDCKSSFGGIQVVFCGDFFQLPPVSRLSSCKSLQEYTQPISSQPFNIVNDAQLVEKTANDKAKFCFQTSIWNKIIHRTFVLKKIYRQHDSIFANMLELIRKGLFTGFSEIQIFSNNEVHCCLV